MPDVTHPFVSGIADGGDATLVRPSNWNAAHPWQEAIDVGTTTLSTDGNFLLQLSRLQISSTNRLTLGGDSTRVVVFGQTDSSVPNIIGFPFRPAAPFRIPAGYANRWMGRVILGSTIRGIVEGDGEMKIFDDQGPSRTTLTGKG